MTKEEGDILIRLLSLIVECLVLSFNAVPKAFRPAGIGKKLEECQELVRRLEGPE